MTNLNSFKMNLFKDDRKVSILDLSKVLTEFSNDLVIKTDEEYAYDA